MCNWDSCKMSRPPTAPQHTHVYTAWLFSLLHHLDLQLAAKVSEDPKAVNSGTHNTNTQHSTTQHAPLLSQHSHAIYTNYSPPVQPSLPLMSQPEDPPPLAHLSPPQPLCQQLSDTSQSTHQTQAPAHLCSSVTRHTLINNKCILSIHKVTHNSITVI